MMNIGQKISYLRKQKGWSQLELAERVGISQQSIQWIESGKTDKTKYFLKIAMALNVDPVTLEFSRSMRNAYNTVPKGYVPILEWNEIFQWLKDDAEELSMNEETRDFVPSPLANQPERQLIFALKVINDVMGANSPAIVSFNVGTIIFVDPLMKPRNGDYIIVCKKGEAIPFFRQLIEDGNRNYLKPINQRYDPEEMSESYSFLGVVISRQDIFV